MGCGSSVVAPARDEPPGRLVIYSEHAAELPNFEEALKMCGTQMHRYDYESTTPDNFVASIAAAVKKHGLFERIALAPHGPKRPPLAPDDPRYGSTECFWELSGQCVLTDPCELNENDGPFRRVLHALGAATIDGGCVDLLSCSILNSWAFPRSAWPSLRGFSAIEEETRCSFHASTHALHGNPLQAEDEWLMETDDAQNIKLSYFLPWQREAHMAYAKANAALIKVAPIFQHYALGDTLGRGSFAIVREGKRRVERHAFIPERVAIKVIDKAKTNDLGAIKRECSFMSSLEHPNIIRKCPPCASCPIGHAWARSHLGVFFPGLYEIFDASAKLYIVMELAAGGDLFDRIVSRGSYTEVWPADPTRAALKLDHARVCVSTEVTNLPMA